MNNDIVYYTISDTYIIVIGVIVVLCIFVGARYFFEKNKKIIYEYIDKKINSYLFFINK